MAAAFGRRERERGEDRDADRDRERVATLPAEAARVAVGGALDDDWHDDDCSQQAEEHGHVPPARPDDGGEEEEDDRGGPRQPRHRGRRGVQPPEHADHLLVAEEAAAGDDAHDVAHLDVDPCSSRAGDVERFDDDVPGQLHEAGARDEERPEAGPVVSGEVAERGSVGDPEERQRNEREPERAQLTGDRQDAPRDAGRADQPPVDTLVGA